MGTGIVQIIVDYFDGKKIEPMQLMAPELYRKANADSDPNIKAWN